MHSDGTQIGIISDTHGLLRPQAIAALQGVDLILHAGDIGKLDVLTQLENIAPVTAVRGNNDREAWAEAIPEQQTLQVGAVSIHLLHIAKELTLEPKTAGVQVVVSGHSHQPLIEEQQGILFINPGSAGPRRFHLPVSIAYLQVAGTDLQAKIVELTL